MKCLLLVVFILSTTVSYAQDQENIHWSYNYEKLDSSTFIVHLIANLDKDCYIYSGHEVKGMTYQPATFIYGANTGVSFDGPITEIGNVIHCIDSTNADVYQYEHKVEFIRTLIVDSGNNIRNRPIGQISVLYQTCTPNTCQHSTRKTIQLIGPK